MLYKEAEAFTEMAKCLTTGSKKYSPDNVQKANEEGSTKKKWRPLPPEDKTDETSIIIAFGNGAFASTMKGKRAVPTKEFRKALKRQVCTLEVSLCENGDDQDFSAVETVSRKRKYCWCMWMNI